MQECKELEVSLSPVAMAMVVDVPFICGRWVSLETDLTDSLQSLAEHARRQSMHDVPLELAVGDSSVHQAAFWIEMRSSEQPTCNQAIV